MCGFYFPLPNAVKRDIEEEKKNNRTHITCILYFFFEHCLLSIINDVYRTHLTYAKKIIIGHKVKDHHLWHSGISIIITNHTFLYGFVIIQFDQNKRNVIVEYASVIQRISI